MMAAPTSAETGVLAELYVRSLAPRHGERRLQRVIDRLEGAENAELIREFEIHLTGDAVPIRPEDSVTAYGARLSARIGRFEEWAQRTDRSLGDAFDRRHILSTITGQLYEAVIPPTLALVEWRDGRLSFISPCVEAGTPVTVEDRLAVLKGAEPVDEQVTGSSQRPPATDPQLAHQ